MTDVYHILEDVRGRPLQRQRVTVTLVAPGNSFLTTGNKPSVLGVLAVDSDGDGRVDFLGLIPNASYEQVGTYYVADCRDSIRRTDEYVYYFTVPASGGPYRLRDLLIAPPPAGTPLPPVTAHPLSAHTDVDFTGELPGYAVVRNPGNTGWIAAPVTAGPHAPNHAEGGSDPVTLTLNQVTGLNAALAARVLLTRMLTAGAGLSGGGDLTADRTFAVVFGSIAGTVAQGDDARLADARTPLAHAATHGAAGTDPVTITEAQVTGLGADLAARALAIRSLAAGTGLSGGGDLTADRTFAIVFGTTAGTATQGNDTRLADARTPTAHAATHTAGGSDEITVAQSQVTGLAAALAALATDSLVVHLAGAETIAGQKTFTGGIKINGDAVHGLIPVAGGYTDLAPVQSFNNEPGWQVDLLRLAQGRFDFSTNGNKAEIRLVNSDAATELNVYNTATFTTQMKLTDARALFPKDVEVGEDLQWGGGDTKLFRASAGEIQTPGSFTAFGNVGAGGLLLIGGNAIIGEAAHILSLTGVDLAIADAGRGLRIKEGSNARMGRATLVGGAATISNTSITDDTEVFAFAQSPGGVPGALYCSARNPGTDFTITSVSATDTSVVAWLLVEPA